MVDSKRILTQLRINGYEIINSYKGADVVVVNACGFIDSTGDEPFETIGDAINENGKAIVAGCFGVHENESRNTHPKALKALGDHDLRGKVIT